MNLPFFLARRLSLSSNGRKSSPAVRVAVTAVALSVAVMLASVAIVLGFKREIREKVLGFNSHITLYTVPTNDYDDNLVSLTPSLSRLLDSLPYVADYSLQASIPAILKTRDNFKGIYMRSLSDTGQRRFLTSSLEEGKIPDYTKDSDKLKIVVSRAAARQLKLKVGDKIDTYFMSDELRVRRLEVAAIYNSHFDNYDDLYLFGDLSLIQELGQISKSQGTSIVIDTDDFRNISEYSEDLHNRLLKALADGTVYRLYRVDNAIDQGAGYFRWLSLLDTNVAVILILMTVVACVTLISGMLIIILDKKNFIGLLRALGACKRRVRMVFVYMAMRVALTGIVIGNALMLTFLYIQGRWHVIPLDPDAYYIDFVPVEFNWWAFAAMNAGVFVITYLSLLLPSWFAARISPAETMRYE